MTGRKSGGSNGTDVDPAAGSGSAASTARVDRATSSRAASLASGAAQEGDSQAAARGASRAAGELSERGIEEVAEEATDRAADKIADRAVDKVEAGDGRTYGHGGSDKHPFGRPGKPLRDSPFMFGLTAALGVLTAWLMVQAVISATSVLILIIVSLFLAIGLNPAVLWLQARDLSRRLSVALVFLSVIAVFALFGLAIVPALTEQAGSFVKEVPAYVQQLQNDPLIRSLDQRYQVLGKLQEYVTSGDLASGFFGGLLGVAGVVISAVFSGLTVLVLTLYFLGSLNSIKAAGYRMVPRTRRTRVALLVDEVVRQIGGYVLGNLIISVIAGVVTFIFLALLQVPYALALALFVAITDLIPMVGAVIGAAVASSIGFLVSPQVGIACVVFFIIYQQVENYIISPPIFKSSIDVPPIATIIGALLGGALLGVVGALLGIPLAAAFLLIVREVVQPRQERL